MKKNTFRAKITLPDGSNKILPDCVIYKGKLVQIIQVGIGKAIEKGGINSEGEGETWEEFSSYRDEMRPFLSKFLMGNRMEYFRRLLDKSNNILTPQNEAEILEVSFVLGRNEGNYLICDLDKEELELEMEEQRKISNREIPITITENTFGLRIAQRLPSDIWNHLRPYAKYWTADDIDEWFEDVDDFFKVGEGKYLKGWYYTKEIREVLKKLKFEIN